MTPSGAPHARDLLGMQGLSGAEILHLLDEAATMRRRSNRGAVRLDDLAGRVCCLVFFEPSTRTMNSFAAAARALSADVVQFVASATSATAKGETLVDTAANLQAIGADVLVLRHKSSGAPQMLAGWLAQTCRDRTPPGVVNAGDGWHEHPTQALLDMFTLREQFGRLEGLDVVIVGDILHSRVARSDAWGLTACGANVTLVAPSAWIPTGVEVLGARGPGAGRLSASSLLDGALAKADAVIALRIQRERLGDEPGPSGGAFAAEFGLTAARMAKTKESCVVMHPGPVNRGIEMTGAVTDSPRSLILTQVANGVFVRMAVLARCTRSASPARGAP